MDESQNYHMKKNDRSYTEKEYKLYNPICVSSRKCNSSRSVDPWEQQNGEGLEWRL
jgi:hypothetical protein